VPLLGHTYGERQDKIDGITPYEKHKTPLPGLLPNRGTPVVIRLARRAKNQHNIFVELLWLYPYMEAIASNLDALRLKNIANPCIQLRTGINLEEATSYMFWADTTTATSI
jgi:hypothetical protein